MLLRRRRAATQRDSLRHEAGHALCGAAEGAEDSQPGHAVERVGRVATLRDSLRREAGHVLSGAAEELRILRPAML